ncbi:MAG TPA: hypothetical protein VHM65_02200 [Candidatus Lustribacter sp.]|nr:hypothetical protein [Candidatus Lustribacter sp.]
MTAFLVLLAVLAVPLGYVLRAQWRTTGSQIDSVIESVLAEPSPTPLRALTPVRVPPRS